MPIDIPRDERIERAEDLILRLRDIQSCHITTDETGEITEIHVVALSDRPPKMIARDVETCLSAGLGLFVDYRKIGVVMLNSMKETARVGRAGEGYKADSETAGASVESIVDERLAEQGDPYVKPLGDSLQQKQLPELEFLEEDVRVRFSGLRLSIEENRVDIEVRLKKGELDVVGCLADYRGDRPMYAAIAGATVHALRELLDENFHLCLSGIDEVEISGHNALLAVVEMIEGRMAKSFAGCVFVGRDPNEAAVLAVLSAVNRSFGRWKSRKEVQYTIK